MQGGPGSKSDRTGAAAVPGIWIETENQKEAVRALEMLHFQLLSVDIDPYSWKWALIALHHALQNFIVASVTGNAELAPLRRHQVDEALSANFCRANPFPDPSLDYLPELYKQMKHATGYHPPDDVEVDVRRLNELRNTFIHSMPVGWRLQVDGLPALAESCMRVIDWLGWNPGHFAWSAPGVEQMAKKKFSVSLEMLRELDRHYRKQASQ